MSPERERELAAFKRRLDELARAEAARRYGVVASLIWPSVILAALVWVWWLL